jgi:hypothetical protein
MKREMVTDWIVRALLMATFFALLLAPNKWGFPFVLGSFAVLGIWSMLSPQGILGWAKTAHPSIDVDDRSIWWVPRLIGGSIVVVVLLIIVRFIAVWR